MNKRIDELATQAGAKIETPHWVYYDDFSYQKFAELIVRECMDNLAWHGEDEAVSKMEWFKVNKLGIK